MPLTSAAATTVELSRRQRAKCQTTGPVSSRPLDLCRATRLRRRDVWLYSHSSVKSVFICAWFNECVFLTPSTAHSDSALEMWSSQMKDKCCFPESSWPLKHNLYYKTLGKGRGPMNSLFKMSITMTGLIWSVIKLPSFLQKNAKKIVRLIKIAQKFLCHSFISDCHHYFKWSQPMRMTHHTSTQL